ncbi:MAG: AraC family transcriptional regulator [Candidatus Acidiferrales bacterium]
MKKGTNPVWWIEEPARDVLGTGPDDKRATLDALIPVLRDVRLRKILQAIESHPSRKIHDLAVECNLSPSHLQHLFKERTGLGLGHLLTEQRMQRAIDFLANTNLTIKEIAGALGYEHASSFTRAFERHFRQAPSCYRQAQGLNTLPIKEPPNSGP